MPSHFLCQMLQLGARPCSDSIASVVVAQSKQEAHFSHGSGLRLPTSASHRNGPGWLRDPCLWSLWDLQFHQSTAAIGGFLENNKQETGTVWVSSHLVVEKTRGSINRKPSKAVQGGEVRRAKSSYFPCWVPHPHKSSHKAHKCAWS